MVNAWDQLFHVEPCLIFSKAALLDDPIEEFSPVAAFSDDVEVFGLGVDIVKPYDVWVVLDSRNNTSFFKMKN